MDLRQKGRTSCSIVDTKPNGNCSESTAEKILVNKKYTKRGNAGIEGSLFQISILTVFMLNAAEKIDSWRLSTENIEGDKFDDVILEYSNGAILLQAKHRKNAMKKVTKEDLSSTNTRNDDFSLAKYFFSYQKIRHTFKVENIIVCTNAHMKVDYSIVNEPHYLTSEHILYFEGVDRICYTFCNSFACELEQNIRSYHRENLQGKDISTEIICYENILDFLRHLQLIVGYPSGEDLDRIIQGMISQSKLPKILDCRTTYEFVKEKMMGWFTNLKGTYLHRKRVKYIFCEIANDWFCQTLEDFKIFLKSGDHFLDSRKKIIHLISPKTTLLHVIKVYRALQTRNVMFVNTDDNIDLQNNMLDSFEDTHYTHLVLISSNKSENNITQVCSKVIEILDKSNYKIVILVAITEDRIAQQFKTFRSSSYKLINENISFSDLTEDTQANFMEKGIHFQGSIVVLSELLAHASKEDLDRILNCAILERLARNETIEVGTKIKSFDENLHDCYINRSFNQNREVFLEENFYQVEEGRNEKIIVISGCAGMGKSTLLTNVAVNIKKTCPNLWVIRIDINNYSKSLRGLQEKRVHSVSIMELLESQDSMFRDNFEKCIFSLPGKVVLMIDGVDEVSPDYVDVALRLIEDTNIKSNFVKIFVTTRPHLCDILESNLDVQTVILEPFSKQNQIDFLSSYWIRALHLQEEIDKEKCYVYAQALEKKMSTWINDDTKHTFVGIPMQTRMLAEIFQERHPSNRFDGCREYAHSGDANPKLPRKIDLFELYQLFISKKRDDFIQKSNPSGTVVVDGILKEKFKEYYDHHCVLAFELFYGRDNCEMADFAFYKVDRNNLNKENLLRIGIVQLVDGELDFVHRTFAEYFLALCFLKELKCEHQNQILRYDFKHILVSRYASGFRAFFDSFLQKELHCLPQDTFKTYRSINLTKVISYDELNTSRSTPLHLLSKEGCIGILRFLFKCLDFALRKYECYSALKLIMKRVDVDMKDKLGRTALHLAAGNGHLDVIELLLNRGANVNHTDRNGTTPLHEAIIAHYYDVVDFLVRRGANVNIKLRLNSLVGTLPVGSTILHLAAFRNDLDMFIFLVENSAAVDIKNRIGCTPLHIAARNGNLEMVRLLIEKGATVDIQDNYGRTALHEASRGGHLEVMTLLLNSGADHSITNIFGRTPMNEDTDSRSRYMAWRVN